METIRAIKILLTLAVISLFVSCQPSTNKNTLTIAVAANAQYALEEIVTAFSKQHDCTIHLTTGSSGKLTTQITQGAPFHLFFSANMQYPDTLYKQGFSAQPPIVYANGSLVLWSTTLPDISQGTELLLSTGKVAIANPTTAPYGALTQQLLEYEGIWYALQNKLVLGESIAQVNHYIDTGACSIGVTSKSSVLAPNMRDKGQWLELPPDNYGLLPQGAIITQYGKGYANELSQAFLAYVQSHDAKRIFEAYGYYTHLATK